MRLRRYLISVLLGYKTLPKVLMCLHGAKWCLTHDVSVDTIRFEVQQIDAAVDKLEALEL
jgi:hypothetical protein